MRRWIVPLSTSSPNQENKMIFFTADTHFTDPRVLRIDRRPFANLVEHDATLIANWNDVVGPDDEVWHLGDFASSRTTDCFELLGRLNGTMHLVIGNNDPEPVIRAEKWASVQHYAEIKLDDELLILCHYPFRTWNKMGKRSINLHGHSHGRLKPVPRQYDVGVDPFSLKPITLEQILQSRRRAL